MSACPQYHLGTSTMCLSRRESPWSQERPDHLRNEGQVRRAEQECSPAPAYTSPNLCPKGLTVLAWLTIILLVVIGSKAQMAYFFLTCKSALKSAGVFSLASISIRAEFMIAFTWRCKRCVTLILFLFGMLSMIRGSPLQESSSSCICFARGVTGLLPTCQAPFMWCAVSEPQVGLLPAKPDSPIASFPEN